MSRALNWYKVTMCEMNATHLGRLPSSYSVDGVPLRRHTWEDARYTSPALGWTCLTVIEQTSHAVNFV